LLASAPASAARFRGTSGDGTAFETTGEGALDGIAVVSGPASGSAVIGGGAIDDDVLFTAKRAPPMPKTASAPSAANASGSLDPSLRGGDGAASREAPMSVAMPGTSGAFGMITCPLAGGCVWYCVAAFASSGRARVSGFGGMAD
jgi:hypothetical protein